MARQRVVEAVALRQFAAAQILPNLNAGMNYDDHTAARAAIKRKHPQPAPSSPVHGAGANAVGAGTSNIPGVQYNLNISQSIYTYLSARQAIRTQELNTAATRNDVLLRASTAYVQLLRAECLRAIAIQVRDRAQRSAQ